LTGFLPFAQSPKRADFEYWVQASIQEIKQGNFQKVVFVPMKRLCQPIFQ
jgi:isochorismate synthase EntC